MKRKRRQRKRAFAFGLCFHPWHFEIMRRLRDDKFLTIGPMSGVMSIRQAYALLPKYAFQIMLCTEPGHDEGPLIKTLDRGDVVANEVEKWDGSEAWEAAMEWSSAVTPAGRPRRR